MENNTSGNCWCSYHSACDFQADRCDFRRRWKFHEQKTIDALQQQDSKKVLSCVPDDFAEAVIDYYDLNKDELNEAIEDANMLTVFNEIRTVKVKKKKIVDKKKYTLKSLDKDKNTNMRSYINTSFDTIERVWETDGLKKFYMTQFSLLLKDEDDGEKTK